MFVLLAIILVIVFLCWVFDAILGAIQSPSQKPGGNPNASGGYGSFNQEPPPLPPKDWGPPPTDDRWSPNAKTSPPPPTVIYVSDSDPTPPWGIPKQ